LGLVFLIGGLGPAVVTAAAETAVSETSFEAATATPTPVEKNAETPATEPTPLVVLGVLKMKDVYKAGAKAFKEKDYEKAERYLTRALEMEDPYTAKYYYAEAHALVGLIYQKYLKVPDHRKLARLHYLAALKLDPATEMARRHLSEVSGE
jgi:tetratricopeptide (TPR) repeat protein